MTRILFICHGNICRSVMAQYVLEHLARQRGLALAADSAATSAEELGSPIHPEARRVLARAGVPCGDHRARRLRREDYDRFDLLIGMDGANLRNMAAMLGGDPDGKFSALLDWAGRPGQAIADPWYTRDFDAACSDVLAGCTGLLDRLEEKGALK